jgi:hypothetical protein
MRLTTRKSRLKAYAIVTAALAAGTMAFTGSALAQTFTATNEGQFETDLGLANTAGGTNIINLSSGVLYQPTHTLAITNGNLTINGATTPDATSQIAPAQITGGALTTPAPGAPVFTVSSGVTVTFNSILMALSGSAGNGSIDDFGTVNINSSTINPSGPGLTVENGATATVSNSTISDGLDFGILDEGTATLNNATVTRNANGGIDNTGFLTLNNSVVAQNGTPDCLDNPANVNDHSFDGDGSCGATASGNAMLGPLQLHGGTTESDIPKLGSPLIGAGDPAKCPTVDQRGAPSPAVAGHACDIGAVETYYGVAPVLTTAPVTVSSASPSGTVANYVVTWRAGSPVTSTAPVCSPASGSVFPVGQTTVTCNGTDSQFGGSTTTATFTVTDTQSTPPVITTSGNQSVVATSAAGATATYTATATDAVDGTDPVTCTASLGTPPATVTTVSGTTVFPIGATLVTCNSHDAAGLNATPATFTLTVTDPAPVVAPQADVSGSGATGSTVTFNPAVPSATDFADGTDPVTCTASLGTPPATVTVTGGPSGTVFPVGTTLVTCSATNHATPPQTGSTTFHVTITSVTPSSTTDNITGEVPHGTQAGALQITANPCDFGPVFIPSVAATYTCTTNATVTSTDANAALTINDTKTTNVGHLVNSVGPTALVTGLTDLATSSHATGPVGYTPLTGAVAPVTLLNYVTPVTSDLVTLKFQQAITAAEPLTFGTYGATVLLSLTTTTP